MATPADAAREALFQVSHGAFVTERKRLSTELRAHDKAAAATLAKQARPSVPAWAVNQLWWKARAEFDALLSAVQRVRDGDLAATAAHRAALQALLARAGELLRDDGNAAADATLRKVEFTLSNVAMAGFAPDAPGMLVEERDPPGFDALAGFAAAAAPAPVLAKVVEAPLAPVVDLTARREAEAEARRLREEEAARQAARAAELKKLDDAVEAASAALSDADAAVVRAEAALEATREARDDARARLDEAVRVRQGFKDA